ncbi:MAG: hypothetical protein ACI4V1_01295, partial [Eubacteriales bacterium]
SFLHLLPGQSITLLAVALLLCGFVTASETMKRGSFFRRVRVNYAFFGFALLSAVLAPLLLLTKFGASWVGGKPCGLLSLFALLPALVLFGGWEAAKWVRRRK